MGLRDVTESRVDRSSGGWLNFGNWLNPLGFILSGWEFGTKDESTQKVSPLSRLARGLGQRSVGARKPLFSVLARFDTIRPGQVGDPSHAFEDHDLGGQG